MISPALIKCERLFKDESFSSSDRENDETPADMLDESEYHLNISISCASDIETSWTEKFAVFLRFPVDAWIFIDRRSTFPVMSELLTYTLIMCF